MKNNLFVSHEKGKEYALLAVDKIETEINRLRNLQYTMDQKTFQSLINERISMLAIAYYNLGS
jgi:hypothetical protein